MAGRVLTDERIIARKLYVEDGITNFTELAKHPKVKCERETVATWAKKEKWKEQRETELTRPDNIASEMLGILAGYMSQLKAKQAAGEDLAPSTMKQLRDMTKSIKQVKDDFDEKGGVIMMWKKLIGYLQTLPQERELLKGLQRIAPGFFTYLEQ